jgi:kinesin family protein C2/C3
VRGVELGPARKQLDSGELFKYKQLVYTLVPKLVIKLFQAFSLQGLLFLGCTNVFITLKLVNTQAERAKQEGRSKEEAVKKLEDSLRNTEAKLKAKEQICQTLTEKVSFSTLFCNKIVMSHVTC